MILYWQGKGEGCHGKSAAPSPGELLDLLNTACRYDGMVGLGDVDTSTSPQLRREREICLLTPGCEENDDCDVRTVYSGTIKPEMIPILEDLYDSRMLTRNFHLALTIFRSFF